MSEKYDFPRISMGIIMSAGDARTKVMEAFDYAISRDFEKADTLLKEAKEYIKEAHIKQTEIMQSLARDEYNGETNNVILPMLFIHAQDTIMTIMTEVNMIEKMIIMYKELKKS